MPKYKMLINARDFDQLRVAIISEKGLLEQIDFESMNNMTNLGNIYKAVITAIEPSLQATFVDYGGNRHGFLPFNEIHAQYYQTRDRRVAPQERFKIGQEVICQVAREEIGLKGAYLTTYLSLPGQYLVMMPQTSKVGISRKIEKQDERQHLRRVMDQITVPDGMGFIIRTAGQGKSMEQIQRDLNILTSTWKELLARSEGVQAPALLYREDDVVSRTIRDYFSEEVNEILVDDPDVYETVSNYYKKILPSYAHIVKPYRGKTPIFSKFNIDEQIERIFARKIQLPSGGSIVIEQTEALVVIDVNSGKTAEGDLESTAFKANLEAAEEIARQLRLRDLGGLVVIDFIDLKDKRNSYEVEQRLRECLKADKARITISGLSRFGLLEMSRQRIKTSKDVKHYVDCPTCAGMGRLKATDFQGLDLLRRIKLYVYSGTVKEISVGTSETLALHLLNHRRTELLDLEKRYNCKIDIYAKPGHNVTPSFDITRRSQAEEKENMVMPAPLSLSTMAASMSEKDINQRKDYREEKLETLEKWTFEELRNQDVPPPSDLNPFERFNFTVRVALMKRHGLFESKMEDFKDAIRSKITQDMDRVAQNQKGDDQGDDSVDLDPIESENEEVGAGDNED